MGRWKYLFTYKRAMKSMRYLLYLLLLQVNLKLVLIFNFPRYFFYFKKLIIIKSLFCGT